VPANQEFPELSGAGKVKFGCGFVVGILFGFFLFVPRLTRPGGIAIAVTVLVTAIVFGFAARLLGDEFWRDLRWWM
jgi:hypothetical protein